MASFDLGTAVRVTRVVAAGTPTAYRVSQDLLQSYHRRGYAVHVRPCEEPELDHPCLLEGEFSKSDGTRVSATVALTPGVPAGGYRQTQVDVRLKGRVVVGGAKGMFATAPMVQKIAREKLEGYLDQVLAGVPPEAATPPPSEEAPPPEPAEEEPAEEASAAPAEDAPPAEVQAEPADSPADPAESASLQRAAEVARHDSEIARIEAEVLAAEAKLAEKQAEVEALEAEVAAEDAAQASSQAASRPASSLDSDHDAVLERIERDIASSEAAVREATGTEAPERQPEVEGPFDAVGAFGTAAAEALVSATSDALSLAESLVGAGARVFGGQSEALTRETDLPPPEPLPPAEPPPAPDALPSSERPPEPDPIPAAKAPSPARDSDLEERLAKVKGLFDKGLISEEEYRTKKTELLERFF